ncbi:DUF4440 domain-containing protein [Acidipila sp. EB88]|uniref:nuclear transport factor 2 family protein n=1 Tax=Acidipila sp. EB88 TaxID=2305226 RepID=UPI000F5EECFD|nr:nuclear transport factor 2 family protein [Acidipila sp. EB88]RRA48394.1 nuclear transport factor 2 family protein [Acidipila sp. EB88]
MTQNGKQPTHATLCQALAGLEERLLDPAVRKQRSAVTALLTEEFREVGRSGRVYTRDQILDLLEQEAPASIRMEQFAATPLGPEAALATYVSIAKDGTRTHRSSVWLYREGRWQMLFHQGTPGA